MRSSKILALGVALCLVGGGACGPSGPGSFLSRVSGESLGGVLLEVSGVGIVGFDGRGSTQVYSAPMAHRQNTHRVLLIDPQGGDLLFDIQVTDVGMDLPVVTVVSAAGTDNATRLPAGIEVRIER